MSEAIRILKEHEEMWLSRMNEPAKKGGLRDHATACLYRANALEEARKAIEKAEDPMSYCTAPMCFCAIKCNEW